MASRVASVELLSLPYRSRRSLPCSILPRRKRALALTLVSPSHFNFDPNSDSNPEGVEASMPMLRKRIHSARMRESSEGLLPKDWMEWERSCYASYHADVSFFLGTLQAHLLQVRPAMTLFLFSLGVALLPISLFLLLLASNQFLFQLN